MKKVLSKTCIQFEYPEGQGSRPKRPKVHGTQNSQAADTEGSLGSGRRKQSLPFPRDRNCFLAQTVHVVAWHVVHAFGVRNGLASRRVRNTHTIGSQAPVGHAKIRISFASLSNGRSLDQAVVQLPDDAALPHKQFMQSKHAETVRHLRRRLIRKQRSPKLRRVPRL